MMGRRYVYLCRHAKSCWDSPNGDDFHRPLAGRGERNAQSLNAFLCARKERVQKVLCSSSQRTRQTYEIALKDVAQPEQTEFLDSLYLASTHEVLALINNQLNACDSVVIVGHNPSMHDVFEWLTDTAIANYPTGTWSKLAVTSGWESAGRGSCQVVEYLEPKMLAGPLSPDE